MGAESLRMAKVERKRNCGSGLLTKEFLEDQRVPRGKVYAVDIDSNMIKQARWNLKDLENVELVQSDIANVKPLKN